MHHKFLWTLVVLGLVALAFVGHARSDEDESEDPAAKMAEFLDRTQPGKHHERLAWFLGEWKVEAQMTMPGMPPVAGEPGTSTFSWALEGRWLMERFEGTLMEQPYVSVSLHGFDSYAKNFVSASVNTMDTGLYVTKGVVTNPKEEIVVQYGTFGEYMLGDYNHPMRTVTRKTGEDEFVMEAWDLGIGEDGAKVLEMRYTRKKS